jgi:hypothetical protein
MADETGYGEPIKLSDRTSVVIAPLNVDEMIQADMFAPDGANSQALNKIYAVCSIRQIKQGADTEFNVVTPLSASVHMRALAKRLNSGELLKLQIEQGKIEEAAFSDDLKNELAALRQDASSRQL